MHGKILDKNDLDAFIELDDDEIISIPISTIGNKNIGNFVFISDLNKKNTSTFKTTQYINPISKFF